MKVENISRNRENKIWVVRSGRDSIFYRHFKNNNVIAIGHIQEFDIEVPTGPISPELKDDILRTYQSRLLSSDSSSRQVSSKYGQVDRFINGINIGDTVITLSQNTISVGVIISHCYFDNTNLEVLGDNEYDDCYYNLRYDVTWGQEQPRSTIPYSVEQSLRNNGTVFSISDEDKIKYLSHWINPIHVYESEIRCSVNITSNMEISNRKLTKLSQMLDRLEILSSYLNETFESENTDIDEFIRYLEQNESSFDYKLTAQHDFMSPGFQFLQLDGTPQKRMIFALLFSIVFSTTITEVEGSEVPVRLQDRARTILAQLDECDNFTSTISELEAKVLENVVPRISGSSQIDITQNNESEDGPEFPDSIESPESML